METISTLTDLATMVRDSHERGVIGAGPPRLRWPDRLAPFMA